MKKQALLFLFFCGLIPGYSQDLKWIKFDWVGDSLSNRYFAKAAINLPVKINDLPYRFNMQFDLGATNSMLYGNSILPYMSANKELSSQLDTSVKTWIDSKPYPTFKRLRLNFDNVVFNKVNLGFYQGYGDSLTADSVKSGTIKQIGTIGSDFFKGKVLIIDYPNGRICVTDAIPEVYKKNVVFIDIKFTQGVILLPVEIDGKKRNLMFDTGSSIFALNTNEKSADSISGGNAVIADSIKIHAWGKSFYTYGKKVTKEIKVGNTFMPKTLVYYDKQDWDYFFISNNIWGITGNAYFLNNTIIIDFKNQKFGVAGSF